MRNHLAAIAAIAIFASPLSAQAENIKIGTIFPMSGPAAALGMAASEGVRYAIDEVNKAGGLDVKGKKYQVDLITYDDQLKASESVGAYQRLLRNDDAKYVFTMISASHMAVKDMIEQDNVLALTSAISSKAVDANSKHTIRLYSTISDYLPPMIRWMKEKMPGERVVLFYPNDESGWEFSRLTSDLFAKVGFKVISTELVDRSARDFQAQLTRIIATNPDIIDLGPQAPATAGLIVRQARDLGYKKAFTVLGGSGARDIVAAAGPAAAEGLVHMLYADPANESYKPLAERFRQKVGQAPNELIVNFYDAARALLKAMSLADNPNDPQQVRKVFPQAFPMKSLQGEQLTFGGKEKLGIDAQIMTASYIAVIKGGKSVVVGVAK